jgi:hypothetical protein
MNVTAILSLLHAPPGGENAATRRFRREPVLAWTLRRVARAAGVTQTAILCWEDQLEAVAPIAEAARAHVLAKGPRCAIPPLEAIAASRRWADGWRGGLLGTCCFDQGFYGPWHNEVLQRFQSEAALLVEADGGLVDAGLLDGLIEHARQQPAKEYCFLPAAPGLGGAIVRRALLEQLAATQNHLGKLLHYWPDIACRDPITTAHCAAVPTGAARTLDRFTLDSQRQISRLERMTLSLNGQLLQTEAEALVQAAARERECEELPREVTLEVNSIRRTSPLYWPGRYLPILRPEMGVNQAAALFAELAGCDDLRLTLGGTGDPMLSEGIFDIIAAAAGVGIRAIHVETDLVGLDAQRVRRLAESPVDVVSVQLPALRAETYQQVMGSDRLGEAIGNVRELLVRRQELGRGTPIVVPTFVKCRQNAHEMEGWYDYWLRAAGTAVIAGPSDCGGRIADVAVADMSPSRRRACRRLGWRMTVLCNGRIASCENDVMGEQAVGEVGRGSVREVCGGRLAELRQAHAAGKWDEMPLCGKCREWDRR